MPLLALPYPSWLSPEILPGLPFRWYGLMYLFAFGTAYLLVLRQIKKDKLSITNDEATNLFFLGDPRTPRRRPDPRDHRLRHFGTVPQEPVPRVLALRRAFPVHRPPGDELSRRGHRRDGGHRHLLQNQEIRRPALGRPRDDRDSPGLHLRPPREFHQRRAVRPRDDRCLGHDLPPGGKVFREGSLGEGGSGPGRHPDSGAGDPHQPSPASVPAL